MRRASKWFKGVGILAIAMSAGSVLGQARPGTAPVNQPGNQQLAPANGPFATLPGQLPVLMNDDPYARSTGQEYPATAVHDAVDANARAAFTRAVLARAQTALDQGIRDLTRAFENSIDYKETQKAEQQAWEEYTAARNEAVRPLLNDAKYQANLTMKEQLGDKIAERRDEKAGVREIIILAHAKLDYAQVARDMEIVAIKNSSAVTDARRKLIVAGHKMSELKAKFDESVRTNADLLALRHGIEDAHIAAVTADAYRNGAVDAANTALDYAYYKNRYSGNYSSYPYNYPTVYPVGTRY